MTLRDWLRDVRKAERPVAEVKGPPPSGRSTVTRGAPRPGEPWPVRMLSDHALATPAGEPPRHGSLIRRPDVDAPRSGGRGERFRAYEIGYRDGALWTAEGNDPEAERSGIRLVSAAACDVRQREEIVPTGLHGSYWCGFEDGARDARDRGKRKDETC